MSHKTHGTLTIRDVANHANVAVTTVSRVLNNEPNVREETRARVFKAVRELGYKPNISARSLASARSYCVGLFYDTPESSYFNMLLVGALVRCREEGYQLVVESFGDDFKGGESSILDRVKQLTLDGVILPEPLCNDPALIDALYECHIPYVRISPQSDAHHAPYVCVDDYAEAYKLTSYLISLGHKQLGIVRGRQKDAPAALRYEAFLQALRDHDLDCPPEHQAYGDFSYSSGLAGAEKILKQKQRPTAIFASNDDMAAAVIATANRLGLSVPEDLSVAGFDNSAIAMNVLPHLTTVNQNTRELGEVATELLFKRIKGFEEGHESDELFTILNTENIIRESTAPPKLFAGRWL